MRSRLAVLFKPPSKSTKTSSPRTFSSIFTNVSPSGNGEMVQLPSSMPMYLQMARARGSFDVPEKTFTGKKFSVKKENPPDWRMNRDKTVTTNQAGAS